MVAGVRTSPTKERRTGRVAAGSIPLPVLSLLAALATVLTPAPQARAEIGSYLVFDLADGTIVDEKNALKPWFPASLTKMMTAYVAFRAMREGEIKGTSPVRISPQAFAQPPSRMGFQVGTVITVDAAIRILMTKSANDIAVALAEAVGGTERAFVERMNRHAAAIGMTQTRFVNPHGLPSPEQVSSARDLGLLVRAIRHEFPEHAGYFTMSGIRIGEKVHRNHNKLVSRFPGTTGMKTGFICSSGFNLAASATRDGRELVAIVLGGYTSRERDERTAEYLELGFRRYLAGAVARGRTIADLVPGPDTPVEAVDLRPIVCGPTRPQTPYDNGVINFVDAEAASATPIAYADPSGEVDEEGGEGGAPEAVARVEGGTGVVEALDKPISYLRTVAGVPGPVTVSIGGADASRPVPLSGTNIGGGPAPAPRTKPKVLLLARADPADPEAVIEVAEAVRLAVAEMPEGDAGSGAAGVRQRLVIDGIPLPLARPAR